MEFLIFFVEQLQVITQLCHMYPKLVKIWFLHIMGIVVNSPELIQKVFNSDICMEKPYVAYKLFNLDNGLLSSRYPRWKHDRRFFNNSFKISTLNSFIPIFIETADKLTGEITKYVDGESFNILDYTIRCTLKMICSTSLGMKISDAENEETFDKVFHAVE
jgi:cytochrome P450 family 4